MPRIAVIETFPNPFSLHGGACVQFPQPYNSFQGLLLPTWATTAVPGASSSLAGTTTSSPPLRSPKTSLLPLTVAPVFTSTHSALPSRILITNVRCKLVVIADVGTNKVV